MARRGRPGGPRPWRADQSGRPREHGEVVSTVVRGYSLVEAASTDEVTKLLASHPFVGRGGTLQVNEVLQV